MAQERKVYTIPKYLDDLPEVIVVPVDVAGVWLATFISLFFFNTFIAVFLAFGASWAYSKFKKGKPKNYIYLVAYKFALLKTKGLPSPVSRKFKE